MEAPPPVPFLIICLGPRLHRHLDAKLPGGSCSVSGKRQRGSRVRDIARRHFQSLHSQPLSGPFPASASCRSPSTVDVGRSRGQYRRPWVPSTPSQAAASHRPLACTRVGCGTDSTPSNHFRQSRSVFLCHLSRCWAWPAGLSFAGFMIPSLTTTIARAW